MPTIRSCAAACSIAAALLLAAAALSADDGRGGDGLPLGDGRIGDSARAGWLMSCQTRFDANAPGAWRTGDWVRDGRWYPAEKPVVPGSTSWPNARIAISVEGGRRVVRANNLPTHPSGDFPIPATSEAWRYDRNPNRIRPQEILLTLPALPQEAAQPGCVPMGMIGFALTGVAIFNAVDAGGRDAPAHEIQDACNAHPQRQGQYHYHSHSPCLADLSGAAGGHSALAGYALDGFGIYGPHGEGGRVLRSADLDACHGHSHAVTWDGQSHEIYHYHFTADFPYTIGCFRGAVGPALLQRFREPGPGAGRGPGAGMGPERAGMPGRPPQDGAGGRGELVLVRAAAELRLPLDALRRALGPPPPDLTGAARRLGIDEARLRAAMQRAMAGD